MEKSTVFLTLSLDSNGRGFDDYRQMLRPMPKNTGPFSSDDLQDEADRLIDGSLSLNTMKTYETGLSVFTIFFTTAWF